MVLWGLEQDARRALRMFADGRPVEHLRPFHVSLIVTAGEQGGSDSDLLARIVDGNEDDGHFSSQGDIVETGLPSIARSTGALRCDRQDEPIAPFELGHHSADDVPRLGSVNRDATEIAQGSTQGPSEQGRLAEELQVQIKRPCSAQIIDEIPVAGVRGTNEHAFQHLWPLPVDAPALKLEQQTDGHFHCVCEECHAAVSVHQATIHKHRWNV